MINQLLRYFPRPLPVGVTDFNKFSDRIIGLAGQFADPDSMKWALASNVIHLGAQRAYVADEYFIRALRKAAANQVASQVFQDIKTAQEAKAAAQLAEATAQSEATANASQTQSNQETQKA